MSAEPKPLVLPDILRDRANAVRAAFGRGFVALSQAGGFDPARDWCGANLRGVDLRGEDVSGFRFFGANLNGAKVAGARNAELRMFRGAVFDQDTHWPADWLAAIRAGALDVDSRIRRGDPDTGLWADQNVPAWAEKWGRDQYGAHATVVFNDVAQRLRWCPPGSFLMRTEKEAGRTGTEGPQHRVTFTAGFWMFETACTAELWAAVMKRPVSRGLGGFPITQVSWRDAQAFVAAFNAAKPALGLSLPSEAQWEYSCRAGKNTPYSFGKEVTKEQVNFDGDGPILVGSLPANDWGLHEMHGNVWEWCADTWHGSYDGAPRDGSAWIDEGAASRVVRGGAFYNPARLVRSASRFRFDPGARFDYLGFRCARVQVGEAEPGGLSAEPAQAGSVLRFGMPVSQLRPPLEPLTRWREPIPGLPEEAWPDMITLPAGEFLMGAPEEEKGSTRDELPQRRVTVPRPFALGRTAVTFAMWDAALAAGFVPHSGTQPPADRGWGRDDRPVFNFSWHDAQAYCRWLNQRFGLAPYTYRLPSEAEWEYACRAGTTTPFSFGETISTKQANFDGRATYGKGRKGEYRGRTVPVGSLPANPWGLHEMHGNVWEWVEDDYGPYPGQATDASPLVHADAGSRVLRGGSWVSFSEFLRSANRNRCQPGNRKYLGLGFRVARTLG
jgi:formylglycine-generating enzyme required for sulfatase activity